MKTSTDRILTTHVGSIPRPESIRALLRARLSGQRHRRGRARGARRRGRDRGGAPAGRGRPRCRLRRRDEQDELSRLHGRAADRLRADHGRDRPECRATTPAALWARRIDTRREWRAFREYYTEYLPRAMPLAAAAHRSARAPSRTRARRCCEKDLATFKAALQGVDVAEAFVPAIAPAMVGRGQNRYYATEEEYVFAIAEALRTEYRAIVDAGFILQIDDPGLGETWDMMIPAPPLEEYRQAAGPQHRGAQSRAGRHPRGPRALPPLLGQLAGPARARPRPARHRRPHAARQGPGLLGRGGDAPPCATSGACGRT